MNPLTGVALEKEMATHSSILAWDIPWTVETMERATVHGITKELDTTWQLNTNNSMDEASEASYKYTSSSLQGEIVKRLKNCGKKE